MEESTKIIVAYAALMIGIPLLAARLCWLVPGAILAKILSVVVRGLDPILNRAIEGFIAILIACLAFDRFSLHIASGIPVILIIVNALWDWAKASPGRIWSSAAGIIAGFVLYRQVLLTLANEFGFPL